jgi:hypothetical protein
VIDSKQKNLGQGGYRDAEFADSIAVADLGRRGGIRDNGRATQPGI